MTGSAFALPRVVALVAVVAVVALSCSRRATPAPPEPLLEDKVATLSSDPEVAAAERAAIGKLGAFRALLEHPDPTLRQFEVEALVREGSLSEILWFRDVRPTPTGFEGSPEAEPQSVKSVRRGQVHQISTVEVLDWAYDDRGAPRGGETRRITERREHEAVLADALAHCDERNYADRCAALGENYAQGGLGEVRLDTAFQLYSRACAGGSAYGCNAAGWAILHGRGVAKDLPAAAQFFARGCTTGSEHPFACDSRGFALLSGLAGTSRNLALGQRLLLRACERGVPQSCLLLELLRVKRLRVGSKLDLACEVNVSEQISRCVNDDDPEACFLAGSAYDTGVCGSPRRPERAVDLLRRAATFGATWPAHT